VCTGTLVHHKQAVRGQMASPHHSLDAWLNLRCSSDTSICPISSGDDQIESKCSEQSMML